MNSKPEKVIVWEKVDHLRDYMGTKLGMWFFLSTEMILFTGLFLIYFMYFILHREEFLIGSHSMDRVIGTVNTIILLTSSLTMALSIALLRENKKKLSVLCVIFTACCGIAFLINKYFEWGHKFSEGIYPNSHILTAQYGNNHPAVIVFYGLYYFMTGLHGLHVLVGVILLLLMLLFIYIKRVNSEKFIALELVGLYWHFVDLIWIYLFPLFYLID